MAASATMQSIFLPTPAARLSTRAAPSLAWLTPSRLAQRALRNGNMAVRCAVVQQERDPPKEAMSVDPAAVPPSTQATSKKASPSITDLLEFSSPAPERINGRLAMLGFVSAIGAELLSGQDVFSQISHGGFQLFLGATILFSIASFVPFFKGVDVESKSQGFMNSDAELLNGRLAMLGLVALAVTEFAKGGALV
uniref:Uncharacterized protein n=1 Tax=Kalanchoe fedtschenkoi TaxID=63787 RepID=A0A7N0V715_KALFE